jgi:hypothetical protein
LTNADGEYIMVKRKLKPVLCVHTAHLNTCFKKSLTLLCALISGSTFAILIVLVFLVVGLAIGITKYLRNINRANETTAELLKSSQGRSSTLFLDKEILHN